MNRLAPWPSGVELGDSEFRVIRDLLHAQTGILLEDAKRHLVRARLSRRLVALGLDGFPDYVNRLQEDTGEETRVLVSALTTHRTSFFRERVHFDYLSQEMRRRRSPPARLRIWSAGCSTGEEPYSIAATAASGGGPDLKVLGTDISSVVLEVARRGRYPQEAARDVPPSLFRRFFHRVVVPDGAAALVVGDRLREVVRFARLNLMGTWPMHGPFDAVFCRNVMIYFGDETRSRLVSRFRELLTEDGLLFTGLAESLGCTPSGFRYVQPGVYRRAAP